MLLNPYSWPGAEHDLQQPATGHSAVQCSSYKENDQPLQLHHGKQPIGKQHTPLADAQGVLRPLDQLLSENLTILLNNTELAQYPDSFKLQLHRALVELGEAVVQAQAQLQTLDQHAAQLTEVKAQLQAQVKAATAQATRAWMVPVEKQRVSLLGLLQQAQSLEAQLADLAQTSSVPEARTALTEVDAGGNQQGDKGNNQGPGGSNAQKSWPRLQSKHQHVVSMLQSCLKEQLPAPPTAHMLWRAVAAHCAPSTSTKVAPSGLAAVIASSLPSAAAAAAAAARLVAPGSSVKEMTTAHVQAKWQQHDSLTTTEPQVPSSTAGARAAMSDPLAADDQPTAEMQNIAGPANAADLPTSGNSMTAARVPATSSLLDVQHRQVAEQMQGLQSQVRTLQQHLQQASNSHCNTGVAPKLSIPGHLVGPKQLQGPELSNHTAAQLPGHVMGLDLDDPVQWLRDALDLAAKDRTSFDWAVKEVEDFQALHSTTAPRLSQALPPEQPWPARAHRYDGARKDADMGGQAVPGNGLQDGLGQGGDAGVPCRWEVRLRDAYRDTLVKMRAKYALQQKQQASAHEQEVNSLRAELAQCMSALSEAATRWQVLGGDEGMVPRLHQQVERLQGELAESRQAVDTLLCELECVRSQLSHTHAGSGYGGGHVNQGLEPPWWGADSDAADEAAYSMRAHPQYPAWLRPNSSPASAGRHSAPPSPRSGVGTPSHRSREQGYSAASSPTGHRTSTWRAATHGTHYDTQHGQQPGAAPPPWLGQSPLRARSASPTQARQRAAQRASPTRAGLNARDRPPWVDVQRRSPPASPGRPANALVPPSRPARHQVTGLPMSQSQTDAEKRGAQHIQAAPGIGSTDHRSEPASDKQLPDVAAWSPRTVAAHAAVAAAVSALQRGGQHRPPSRALHTQLQQLLPAKAIPPLQPTARAQAQIRRQPPAASAAMTHATTAANTDVDLLHPEQYRRQHGAAHNGHGDEYLQQGHRHPLPASQQPAQNSGSTAGHHVQPVVAEEAVTPHINQQARARLQDAPGSAAINQMVTALLSEGHAVSAAAVSCSDQGSMSQGSRVHSDRGKMGKVEHHVGRSNSNAGTVTSEGSLAYLLAAAEEQHTPTPVMTGRTCSNGHKDYATSKLQPQPANREANVTAGDSNMATSGSSELASLSSRPSGKSMLMDSLAKQQQAQEQQPPAQHRAGLNVRGDACDGVVVCIRCGHQRTDRITAAKDAQWHDEQCSFHPALLENPGHLRYTPEWFACKAAGHTADMPGCYVRGAHFYPAPLLMKPQPADGGPATVQAGTTTADSMHASKVADSKVGLPGELHLGGKHSTTQGAGQEPTLQGALKASAGPQISPRDQAGMGTGAGRCSDSMAGGDRGQSRMSGSPPVGAPQPRRMPAVKAMARR